MREVTGLGWAVWTDGQLPVRNPVCGLRVRTPYGMTNENTPPGRRYNSTARTTNSVDRSRLAAPRPPASRLRGLASFL